MACSENLIVSPRISFSYGLLQSESLPEEKIPLRTNSSPTTEFDFCIFNNFCPDLSPADEIFLNGKIVPLGIKNDTSSADTQPSLPPPSPGLCLFLAGSGSDDHYQEDSDMKKERYKEKRSSLFWRFKRSCSLDSCVSGGSHGRSLCSLQLLSRNKSIGFPENVKQISNNSAKNMKSLQCCSSAVSYQKHKLKKIVSSNQRYCGNNTGVHRQTVNHEYSVLNVPIANLFCLGFFAGIKKKKR